MTQEKVKTLQVTCCLRLRHVTWTFSNGHFTPISIFWNILVKPWQTTRKTSEKYYKDVNLSFNQYILG